jgi:hypothetical protein
MPITTTMLGRSVLLIKETSWYSKKPQIYHKSLTNLCSPFAEINLSTLVVIGTDCIGTIRSCL